jgi:hypothetical protein
VSIGDGAEVAGVKMGMLLFPRNTKIRRLDKGEITLSNEDSPFTAVSYLVGSNPPTSSENTNTVAAFNETVAVKSENNLIPGSAKLVKNFIDRRSDFEQNKTTAGGPKKKKIDTQKQKHKEKKVNSTEVFADDYLSDWYSDTFINRSTGKTYSDINVGI